MKKKLWLLFVLSLVILGIFISNTYALFESDVEGIVNNPIGQWNIKLNEILVSSIVEESLTIDDFVYDINDNVRDGYIAPGSSGYFDLVLDTMGTDVAVKYAISVDLSQIENENITLSVVPETNGMVINNEDGIYFGVLSLDDITNNSQIILRIMITWNDDVVYDEQDTELGVVLNTKLEVPISVSVEQYLGE